MYKIYLSGAMADASKEEQTKNREWFEYNDLYYPIKVFNPYTYYNYEDHNHVTEKEIMRYELEMLKKSDLVIYEEQGYKSIGSSMEIALAYEHGIPILVLNENNLPLHPWIEEMSNRVFNDREDLMDYVAIYYLR